MHEVKLARLLFRRLLEIATANNIQRVKKVVLRVNCLESENGEVLVSALKEMAAGTPLEDAQVEVLSDEPLGTEMHEHTHEHAHDHEHLDGPGPGEIMIERIEA